MKRFIISSVAKKEFFSYVNSALAYTVIVPFLLLSIFLYTRTVLASGEASLRPYFDLLPWFLLLLAPALSMKLLTDEYKNNTLELLFAHPISEAEIILGKFLGAFLFFLVVLVTTFGLPLTLLYYSKADPGQMLGQYIGAAFIGATFLSIGLTASAFVKNAISSFLLSAAIGFVLIIMGIDFFAMLLPTPIASIISDLSLLSRSGNIARGVLDIRDIVYFLTLIGVFLTAGIAKLSERKLLESSREKKKLTFAFLLIIVIGVLVNILLSSNPLRLDLTASRLFSLSDGTKQTVKGLPDLLTVKVFSSRNLPSEMQSVFRQIKDVLTDYKKLNSNVSISFRYPEADPQAAQEARTAGISEVTFNKVGSGKFEMQSGYMGISLQYGDKKENIPFISDTTDLEYQLTRRIRKITNEKQKTIGLLTNGSVRTQILDQIIQSQYALQQISSSGNKKIQGIDALIALDSGDQESTASSSISDYLNQGGKVLLLTSGVSVNPQYMIGQKSVSRIPSFLSDFGISLNNDLIFDMRLNELLTFGSGGTRFLAPYPYWLKALPGDTSFSPLSSVKSISLGWPSSLTLNKINGVNYKELLKTSQNGGKTENNFSISPQSASSLISSGEQLLAVLAEKGESRLITVGSSTLGEDQFLRNNQDNAAFLSNTIDWLVTDKDLAAIPAKTNSQAVFLLKSPTDLLVIQYGNLLVPPAAVTLFAFWYLRRRRKMTQRIYHAP